MTGLGFLADQLITLNFLIFSQGSSSDLELEMESKGESNPYYAFFVAIGKLGFKEVT